MVTILGMQNIQMHFCVISDQTVAQITFLNLLPELNVKIFQIDCHMGSKNIQSQCTFEIPLFPNEISM